MFIKNQEESFKTRVIRYIKEDIDWNAVKLEWELFNKKDYVKIGYVIILAILFMWILIDGAYTSDAEILEKLDVPTWILSECDSELEGTYYWSGEGFYWEMDISTYSKDFQLLYYKADKRAKEIRFDKPINLYKSLNGFEWEYYKRFLTFVEGRK